MPKIKFRRPDAWGRFVSSTHPNIEIHRRWRSNYDPRFGQTSRAFYLLEIDGKIEDTGTFNQMRKAAENLVDGIWAASAEGVSV